MRRVAALVLPELLCELAARPKAEAGERPFGVLVIRPGDSSEGPPAASARFDAVNTLARRYGVISGQSIAEASAFVAGLGVERVAMASIEAALATVAEVALGFGSTVALGPPDTVWVDLEGSAHLFGGEEELGEELAARVRALGHSVRLAIANGPEIARAFARWGAPAGSGKAVRIVKNEHTTEAVRELPVVALPLTDESRGVLVRLGVLTLGDLTALPRQVVAGRLEGEVTRALDLASGVDSTPLVPYFPPRTLEEGISFESGLSGVEPLLFALRGLAARLSARLAGRGEAADALVLTIEHDRSIASLRGAKPSSLLRFNLATPLHREDELRRLIAARLERVRLPAPTVGLRLSAPVLVSAVQRQLELGEVLSRSAHAADELPLVLAELSSDVGPEQVGFLKKLDAHRLEAQSRLEPAAGGPRTRDNQGRNPARRAPKRARRPREAPVPIAVQVSGTPLGTLAAGSGRSPFTRLLPEPVRLDAALTVGSTLAIERRLFSIEKLCFEQRLYAVEWWTEAPVERDYVRLWLRSAEGLVEALAFIDRKDGKRYLQAVAD